MTRHLSKPQSYVIMLLNRKGGGVVEEIRQGGTRTF